MKRCVSLLLATVLLLGLLPATTLAAGPEVVASGYCYNSTEQTWTLDSEGTLTISGTGKVQGPYYANQSPWYNYRNAVKKGRDLLWRDRHRRECLRRTCLSD